MFKITVFALLALAMLSPVKAFCVGSSAVSAIVIETSTNSVVYEKNAYSKMPMASTTKIMTAICAIESGNVDRVVRVNDKAVGIEGSSIYLAKGERLSVRDLLYGLMLNSGNDAAVAIAYAVSGNIEDFVALMNETAKRVGAKNTHFDNPNGLDGKTHYTTAYDLAIITSYALKNKTFSEIVSTYKKTIPNGDRGYDRALKNHNKLLKLYDGCTGVKTGFTKKSGRCLVSSAKRDGTELVAVTLNDGNDWQDHMSMLDYGFNNTYTTTVQKKGDFVKTLSVKGGTESFVKAICLGEFNHTRILGNKENVSVVYDIPDSISAPVAYGETLGKIDIYYKDKLVRSLPVFSSECVEKKGAGVVIENIMILFDFWLDFIC